MCDQRRRAAPSVRPVNDARTSWGKWVEPQSHGRKAHDGLHHDTGRDDEQAACRPAGAEHQSGERFVVRPLGVVEEQDAAVEDQFVWRAAARPLVDDAAGQAGLQALTAGSPDAALARQEALDQRRLAHARRAFDEHEAGPLARGERGQFRGSPGEHLGVR